MKKTVSWGVLGTADVATGRTMPALIESSAAELLALASRDTARGQAVAHELGVPRVYTGYDGLLADPDIDAVYVPLPNKLHFEWSLRALEAGKHVLCEKPLCLSTSEVVQLCAARDRAGRHIEEAFAFRNHGQWAKLEELLANDTIGPVRAVHATLAKQFLDPADIRNNPNAGGGALYDLGSYAIAGCNIIFKRAPKRVLAAIEHDPAFGIDRLTTALLDYGNAHATFSVASQAGPCSWGTHQQLTLIGAKGWIQMNFPFAHARPAACRIDVGDDTSVGSLPTTTFRFEPANHYALQVDRFSSFLLGGPVPSWPIEDALGTLRTIEALFESARTHAWQLLPD